MLLASALQPLYSYLCNTVCPSSYCSYYTVHVLDTYSYSTPPSLPVPFKFLPPHPPRVPDTRVSHSDIYAAPAHSQRRAACQLSSVLPTHPLIHSLIRRRSAMQDRPVGKSSSSPSVVVKIVGHPESTPVPFSMSCFKAQSEEYPSPPH